MEGVSGLFEKGKIIHKTRACSVVTLNHKSAVQKSEDPYDVKSIIPKDQMPLTLIPAHLSSILGPAGHFRKYPLCLRINDILTFDHIIWSAVTQKREKKPNRSTLCILATRCHDITPNGEFGST